MRLLGRNRVFSGNCGKRRFAESWPGVYTMIPHYLIDVTAMLPRIIRQIPIVRRRVGYVGFLRYIVLACLLCPTSAFPVHIGDGGADRFRRHAAVGEEETRGETSHS